MDENNLGARLKRIRREKKMTLSEVASKSGLSTAYLSNIERNATSPTVNNLFKISRALGVEIIDIMIEDLPGKNLLLRREERENLFHSNPNMIYESITRSDLDLSGVCITIAEDCYDEVVTTGHANYAELGICVEGCYQVNMNGMVYTMQAGDTLYVPKGTPHSYCKMGPGRCVTYWIYALPKKG